MPAALAKTHATTVSVTDIKLAASLMALGIPPVPGEEVSLTTGDANRVTFNFLTHGDGDMSADAIIAAWKQEREARCHIKTQTIRFLILCALGTTFSAGAITCAGQIPKFI